MKDNGREPTDFAAETLRRLKARGLHRKLVALGSAAGPRVRVGRREVLQFASNNYLGLANDPRLREALSRGVEKWGWGAGASRLVAGHTEAHAALETDLASFKGTETALVFPTGYQTNLGVVAALAGRGDPSTGSGQACVVMDRACHASLYDAVKLSGARLVRYRHADADDAGRAMEKALGRSRPHSAPLPPGGREDSSGRLLILTDTLFSMDGDVPPLGALADLADDCGAMLLVDEAHATGVLGPTGAGLVEALDLRERITASVGTLSKALGGIGGFVAASREVCELIVNRARSFIYTTALPGAACEAARAALAIVRAEPERRERLLALAEHLRGRLAEEGFDTGRSAGPIVPIVVGEPQRTLDLASALLERDIFCPAIRPPSVPPRTSRLRVSLTSEHLEEDVERLVEALVEGR